MSNDPLTSGRASRPSLAWLARPGLLLAAGVVLAVVSLHLWIDPSNPPGFHRDEASIAYNASTISTSLRDEHGGRLPLYIESFGDYKSPSLRVRARRRVPADGPELLKSLEASERSASLRPFCCLGFSPSVEHVTSASRPRSLRSVGSRPGCSSWAGLPSR